MSIIKALFVDDEPELCELFSEFFSDPTVQIKTFENAQAAVEACKTHSFDVIFLDYRMPGVNGDQLARQFDKNTPIYLLTGEAEPQFTYPFSGVLPKPFDDQKIRTILDALKNIKKSPKS